MSPQWKYGLVNDTAMSDVKVTKNDIEYDDISKKVAEIVWVESSLKQP